MTAIAKALRLSCVALVLLWAGGPGHAQSQEELMEETLPPPSARLDLLRAKLKPRMENGQAVWEYELVVSERKLRLADGTMYKVWSFGGSIPGPTLVAREGDRVRIRLVNETSNPHSLHSHGLWVPHRMDGAPHPHPAGQSHEGMELPVWANPVPPGQSYTYEYIARPAGTHWYHCHVNTNEHLDRGMSGALIILPRTAEPAVDQDLVMLLDEWNRDYADMGTPGHPRDSGLYDIFTINGRSYPETESFHPRLGDVVRVRFINAGALSHSMHLHGHEFLVTHKDGQPLTDPALMDTVTLGPGERVDIVFVANNPGDWPLHCHSSPHVTNAGRYPGGMMAHFLVGPERFPKKGEGPVGPGIRSLRELWRASALRALKVDVEKGPAP
ncbi:MULTISPECIES: multicopper oxidase family protein [Corallococcus]|uniref:multicopper oxidase family protein n=1 Tax=Corallococcus TaxID=83461 RepID=UPI001376BE86|nr:MULTISPECIES: multicopper oxidase domain-containing protein [Corallococcus]NBD07548.1 multicopper oxidase domain-containing protein [Corallococcus silvisoli]